MANLLITLLAIGMGAALLAAGINYGGAAYYEARAEARATELIAQAAKVSQALFSWSRSNNGIRTLPNDKDWSDGTATDLMSTGTGLYLDRLPRLDSYANGLKDTTDFYFTAVPISNVAWAARGTAFDSLAASLTDNGVCNAVARIARGTNAMPVPSASTTNLSTAMAANKSTFDCVYYDANSNGNWDSGESMFFIYRVF